MSSQDGDNRKNDPFYIPTVPMYRELGKEDLNDTIGDQFFDLLSSNLQLSPLNENNAEINKAANKPKRKSLLKPGRPSITTVAPIAPSQPALSKENFPCESRFKTQNLAAKKSSMQLRSGNKTDTVSVPTNREIKVDCKPLETPSKYSRHVASEASNGHSKTPIQTIRPSPRSKPSVMTPSSSSVISKCVLPLSETNLPHDSNRSLKQQKPARKSLLSAERPSIMPNIAGVEKGASKNSVDKENQIHQSRFKTSLANPLNKPRICNKISSTSFTNVSNSPSRMPMKLAPKNSSIDFSNETGKVRSSSALKSVPNKEYSKSLRSNSAVGARNNSVSSGSNQISHSKFSFMAPTALSARRDNDSKERRTRLTSRK